jgi:hypothetical protein
MYLIMQTSGLHHYKGKLSNVFLWLVRTLVISLWTPLVAWQISTWYTTSVHVFWCLLWLPLLQRRLFGLSAADDRCFSTERGSRHTAEKKSNGVQSGDLGGQEIGTPLPNHEPGIVWWRWLRSPWKPVCPSEVRFSVTFIFFRNCGKKQTST